MSLHSFLEYLKYRWKAKGRHGTHSPFVYELVEKVLCNKDVIDKQYLVSYPSLPLQYENLISRIAAYYKYKDVVLIQPGQEVVNGSQVDMLLLNDAQPLQWVSVVNKYKSLLKNNSAVIAIGVHKTPVHTKGWQQLCADPTVRMSIDMYGVGMLLFRAEFKEQQHFILKY